MYLILAMRAGYKLYMIKEQKLKVGCRLLIECSFCLG